jgi:dTDP-4-dehydrorhamnose 3,5-epimerase
MKKRKAGTGLIQGVVVKTLRVIPDERGILMEIMRSDDPFFRKFGQAYISMAYPGVVKAWHYHEIQTDHFCVVKGMGKVVLYDGRKGSPTRGKVNEFFIGERNPKLIVIPPLVMHGFKALGREPAFLLNIPTERYNYKKPDELRLPARSRKIPYNWDLKDR